MRCHFFTATHTHRYAFKAQRGALHLAAECPEGEEYLLKLKKDPLVFHFKKEVMTYG